MGKQNIEFKKLVNKIILNLLKEKFLTKSNRKKLIRFKDNFNKN